MALYEFHCTSCDKTFEQLTGKHHPEMGKCPFCGSKETKKLISAFRVGGRGDLRESTLHGCHDCDVPAEGGHSHDHGHHDHAHSEPAQKSKKK